MRQHTIGEVANSSTYLWADTSVCNCERIIKIGEYWRKLCSNKKWSSFSDSQCRNKNATGLQNAVYIITFFVFHARSTIQT